MDGSQDNSETRADNLTQEFWDRAAELAALPDGTEVADPAELLSMFKKLFKQASVRHRDEYTKFNEKYIFGHGSTVTNTSRTRLGKGFYGRVYSWAGDLSEEKVAIKVQVVEGENDPNYAKAINEGVLHCKLPLHDNVVRWLYMYSIMQPSRQLAESTLPESSDQYVSPSETTPTEETTAPLKLSASNKVPVMLDVSTSNKPAVPNETSTENKGSGSGSKTPLTSNLEITTGELESVASTSWDLNYKSAEATSPSSVESNDDADKHQSVVVIVTELCQQNLFKYIMERRPQAKEDELVREFLVYAGENLDGLAHIHEHDIIHGDIKLENIFLKKDEETGRLVAKIGDFGGSLRKGETSTANARRDVFALAKSIYWFFFPDYEGMEELEECGTFPEGWQEKSCGYDPQATIIEMIGQMLKADLSDKDCEVLMMKASDTIHEAINQREH